MKNIISTKFYSILLNNIYSFYDGSGKTCKVLLITYNDVIIRQNI